MKDNPKTDGSNMITARPQIGKCPLECAECFYNADNYYEDKSVPRLPSVEEATGKIVRVNDGHDSNIRASDVISHTRQYKDKFYNTSIGRLFFPAPVILTINGRDTDDTYIRPDEISGTIASLMAIRFRVNTWNVGLCEDAINVYREYGINTPFLLTDMRYSSLDHIPERERKFYERKKHILNSWYRLTDEGLRTVFYLLKYDAVYWCGNPFTGSTSCKSCMLCEHFYYTTQSRLFYNRNGNESGDIY